MRVISLIFLLIFIFTSLGLAEEDELTGFVVTPQSAEFALYDHLLSPSSVDITLACVGKRLVFEEKIADVTHTYMCDFDCKNTDFEWQVVSERPWVHFDPERGNKKTLTRIQVTVDKDYLKNIAPEDCDGVPCFVSGATFRITYHLSKCKDYSKDGVDSVEVTYYSEKNFSDFVKVYYSVSGPSPQISPKELKFLIESTETGLGTSSKKVKVISGHQGWDYTSSSPWLSLSKEEDQDPTIAYLVVTPTGLKEPGYYRSYVRIRDLATGEISQLLTSIDVKGLNPGIANLFYALFPDGYYKDRVEVSSAQWFGLHVYLGPDVDPYPIYVEVTHSSFPGYEFAYRWQDGVPLFSVASYQGVPVSEIDDLYYSSTGVEQVNVSGFRLAYLPGTAHIKIKKGISWVYAETILDLELVIRGLTGLWKIVDQYKGVEYEHPFALSINENIQGLSAEWGDYHPQIRYSVSPETLYEILFRSRDYIFRYQINHQESSYISGIWSYSSDGISFSTPEPFYGIKLNP